MKKKMILSGNSKGSLYFFQDRQIEHCHLNERSRKTSKDLLAINKVPHYATCALGKSHRLTFNRRRD